MSFDVGGTVVDLVDTPGHPDFIAEVDRALAVLDGAVLVVSAVEGVQAQTRVLMRALRRLRIPTLIFVNKLDRGGARAPDALLPELRRRLDIDVVQRTGAEHLGTPAVTVSPAPTTDAVLDTLTAHDDRLLARCLEAERIDDREVDAAVARLARSGTVHPVLAGSAVTGAGVGELLAALPRLLPAAEGDDRAPLSGRVFKVGRGHGGERLAHVRVFAGAIRVRDEIQAPGSRRGRPRRVTGIRVFERGDALPADLLPAGRIGTLTGLDGVRVGDVLGATPARTVDAVFALPTLESVVTPVRPAERAAVFSALSWLAEQDPLIRLHRDDEQGDVSVRLYGEVQKEVLRDTLAEDFGLAVTFGDSVTLCVERPAGTGSAEEVMGGPENPFLATVGLRVEPAPAGAGARFRLLTGGDGVLGRMPAAFFTAVEDTVTESLGMGPHGWPVTDVVVTLTRVGYAPRQSHAHARFDKSMSSTGADFRGATPLVLAAALRRAGTVVCEPVHRFTLEVPAESLAGLLPTLARLRARPARPGCATTRSSSKATYQRPGWRPCARPSPRSRAATGSWKARSTGTSRCAADRPSVIGAPPTRSTARPTCCGSGGAAACPARPAVTAEAPSVAGSGRPGKGGRLSERADLAAAELVHLEAQHGVALTVGPGGQLRPHLVRAGLVLLAREVTGRHHRPARLPHREGAVDLEHGVQHDTAGGQAREPGVLTCAHVDVLADDRMVQHEHQRAAAVDRRQPPELDGPDQVAALVGRQLGHELRRAFRSRVCGHAPTLTRATARG